MKRAHSGRSVWVKKKDTWPHPSCAFFFFPWITSSLAMRTTSPDTMEAFQRAAISFLSPPEPNLALVVKACFSGVPSGISPAASAPLLS